MRDAHGFRDVAEAVNDPDHGNQAATNAILAAIAANDAICLYLGRRRPIGRSHTEAAHVLQEVCRGTRWEKDAEIRARQLLELIRHKNAAQYGIEPLRAPTVAKIMKQTMRFVEWAETILPWE